MDSYIIHHRGTLEDNAGHDLPLSPRHNLQKHKIRVSAQTPCALNCAHTPVSAARRECRPVMGPLFIHYDPPGGFPPSEHHFQLSSLASPRRMQMNHSSELLIEPEKPEVMFSQCQLAVAAPPEWRLSAISHQLLTAHNGPDQRHYCTPSWHSPFVR